MVIDLTVKKSRIISISLLLFHFLAAIALWRAALPIFAKIVLSLTIVMSGYYHLIYAASTAIRALSHYQAGWRLTACNGKSYNAELCRPYFVTPYLIIMRFHCHQQRWRQRRKTVMLTSRSLSSQDWHQLTLLLYNPSSSS